MPLRKKAIQEFIASRAFRPRFARSVPRRHCARRFDPRSRLRIGRPDRALCARLRFPGYWCRCISRDDRPRARASARRRLAPGDMHSLALEAFRWHPRLGEFVVSVTPINARCSATFQGTRPMPPRYCQYASSSTRSSSYFAKEAMSITKRYRTSLLITRS
jgi:hypothetical protein